MNDRAHERLLSRVQAPAPSADARARAREAALAEFTRVHAANDVAADSQDSAKSERLSRNDNGGRAPMMMNWWQRRTAFGAFASACVVMFATAMLWPVISGRVDLRQFTAPEVQLPAEEPPRATLPATTGAVPPASEPASRPLEKPAQRTNGGTNGNHAIVTPADRKPEPGSGPGRVRILIQPKAATPLPTATDEERKRIVAAGFRAQLQAQANARGQAPQPIVDAIEAQDIGKFPDVHVAEALQRVPGPLANATPDANDRAEEVVVTGSRGPVLASAGSTRLKKDKAIITAGDVRGITGGFVRPSDMPGSRPFEAEGNDRFQHFDANPIKRVAEEPVSTFSVDVDTSSYSFIRRMLNEGRLPQKDAVRVEEMVNYFDYAWPKAASRDAPFEPTIAVTDSPWNKGRKLVHIGIKGYDVPRDGAPDVNLVLLLDVSASMNSPDKLPLAVQSMELLLGSLKPTDTVGIVVYAGAAGTVLEPTPVKDRQKIVDALRSLTPGGSTAGAEGIERAYQLAERNFRKGGVNRVLLATDGDFNVGIDSTDELKGYVERQREKGVMLSVLGFGEGNYRDELAQALAQNGNGVAAYIDTLSEAQKVLVDESSGTLFTIAKDVKIQVEFNPAAVAEYRLVGYETRALKSEDFNNDAVDAGDVGSGHTVTAIYEITPVGSEATSVDPLRYGANGAPAGARAAEYGFVKIRYKLPSEAKSRLISKPIPAESTPLPGIVAREVHFSTAVAGFAQLLRGGQHTGGLTFDDVINAAQGAKGDDPFGYRTEFVQLVRKAKSARGM